MATVKEVYEFIVELFPNHKDKGFKSFVCDFDILTELMNVDENLSVNFDIIPTVDVDNDVDIEVDVVVDNGRNDTLANLYNKNGEKFLNAWLNR